jgi:hypothetical protein
MAYFSMEASAWILAVITIDRYLILVNNTWKQKYSKNIRFNLLIILSIILIIICINLPVAFLNGKVLSPPHPTHQRNASSLITSSNNRPTFHSTKRVQCYTTAFIAFYQKFALILECLSPLVIMITFNWLLIKKTYKSTTRLKISQQSNPGSRQRQSVNSRCESSDTPARVSSMRRCSLNPNIAKESPVESTRLGASFNDLTFKFDAAPATTPTTNTNTNTNTNNNNTDNNTNPNGIRNKKKSIAFEPLRNMDAKRRRSNHLHASNNHLLFEPSNDAYYGKLRRGSNLNRSVNSISDLFTYSNGGKPDNAKQERKNNNTELKVTQMKKSTTVLFASNNNMFLHSSMMNLTDNMNALYMKATSQFNSNSSASSKTINTMRRNKRIVIMLSLLTLSFTVSTLPSSLFYTFFRPILNDKPYKSLLSMSFVLLRHLSHAFNFVIYFTSSSVIKQQLREILNEFNLKSLTLRGFLRCVKVNCCCLVRIKGSNGGGFDSRKSKSTTNNKQSNEDDSMEMNEQRTTTNNKDTSNNSNSNTNNNATNKPRPFGESVETSRYYVNQEKASNNPMSIVQRKISYKRKIRNLKQHSMLSLKSLSSLSDLRGYYSSTRHCYFSGDEDPDASNDTLDAANNNKSQLEKNLLLLQRSAMSMDTRLAESPRLQKNRRKSSRRKRLETIFKLATTDTNAENNSGSQSITFTVPSLQVNNRRLSIN